MSPVVQLLRRAARSASTLAESGELTFRDKNELPGAGVDLVTEADLEVDRVVTEGLDALYPGIPVVSEERPAPAVAQDGDCFLLDPVDGTHNFAAGNPWWAISLARLRGAVIEEAWLLDGPGGALYHATSNGPATCDGDALQVTSRPTRVSLASVGLSQAVVPLLLAADRFAGVRVMGCHSLSLAWVASGRFAVHAARGWPWDVAAGYLLIERAGGLVVDFEGNPRNPWENRYALAGAPQAVEASLEILGR